MDYSPPGTSVHGDSPGKNTAVGYHALLQGICPDPGIEHESPALQADSLPSDAPCSIVLLLFPGFPYETNYLPKSHRSSSASWGEVVGGMGVCGLRQIPVCTNYYQISHNSDTMDLVCLIISVVNSKSLPG